jgi:WD40 repeat protein
VSSVAISPDGQTLVSGSWDNTIKIWDLRTGQQVCTLPQQPSIVEAISISPDGQTLATGGWGNIIKLWNLTTGEEIRTLKEAHNLVETLHATSLQICQLFNLPPYEPTKRP